MTDLLAENARLRAALADLVAGGNRQLAIISSRVKHTDPMTLIVTKGQMLAAMKALATPAPDAVQEAARMLLDNPQAAAKFVVEYMERETGLPFGDMIGLSEMQRIRAIAGDRT